MVLNNAQLTVLYVVVVITVLSAFTAFVVVTGAGVVGFIVVFKGGGSTQHFIDEDGHGTSSSTS